ncbi:MAG: hypothetical protein AAGU32_21770 [Bacillota bacterium]
MEDKPTLKEHLQSRYGRFVRTNDGCYYATIHSRCYWAISISLLLIVAVPAFILLFTNIPWHTGIANDMLVIFNILSFLLPRLTYRFEKFVLLQEGTEDYQNASGMRYSKHMRAVWLATTIFTCAVFASGGFTLSYLRSLTDTPEARCSIKWAQGEYGEYQTVDTEEGGSSITIPPEMEETVQIRLVINHTPYAPELLIDGKTVHSDFDKFFRDSTLVFSKLYFYQVVESTITAADVHDGSVLTLTCGKWSYKWTFVSDSP